MVETYHTKQRCSGDTVLYWYWWKKACTIHLFNYWIPTSPETSAILAVLSTTHQTICMLTSQHAQAGMTINHTTGMLTPTTERHASAGMLVHWQAGAIKTAAHERTRQWWLWAQYTTTNQMQRKHSDILQHHIPVLHPFCGYLTFPW